MKRLLILIIPLFFTVPCMAAKVHPFNRLQLSDFNEESIMKLSAMYGYARYFYPDPHLDGMEWMFYLEDKIKCILTLTNEQEVDSFLLKEFSLLIPQLTFSSVELSVKGILGTDSFYVKENTPNIGFSKIPIVSKIKKVKGTDAIIPMPERFYSFPLFGPLYACFPLALYELPPETQALKQVVRERKRKWKKGFYTSPYFRIANAIINNNIIQHFYAYYEEDNLNLTWLNSSKTYIGQIANCTSYKEYLEYTYVHYALLKDSHVYIKNGYAKPGALIGRYCCLII